MSLFDLFNDPSFVNTPSTSLPSPSLTDTLSHRPTPQLSSATSHFEKFDRGFIPNSNSTNSSFPLSNHDIFSIETVDIDLGTSHITAIQVTNNILYLALAGPQRILRIFLDASQDMQVIDLDMPKKVSNEFDIHSIFTDPYSQHCLLAAKGALFYLSKTGNKAKFLNRFKGSNVTCVAWNKDAMNTPFNSGLILIGTKEGVVFEVILEHSDVDSKGFFSRKLTLDPLKYIRPVFAITEPISYIFFEPFPITSDTHPKYVVFLFTQTKFYQFLGFLAPGETPSFERVFACEPKTPWLMELPNSFDSSFVSISIPVYNHGQLGIPKHLAWLSSQGIYTSSIVMGSQSSGDSVLDQSNLHPLAALENIQSPLGIASLPFHYIVFDTHRILAYFSLSEETDSKHTTSNLNLVWSQPLHDPLVSVTYDPIKKTLWAATSRHLLELIVKDEDRNIWKYYLKRNQFEAAIKYAKTKETKDIVLKTQADFYFDSKRFILSAQYYSKTSLLPFEHVTLKFIEKNEMEALRVYLSLVLKQKVLNSKDSVQAAMIAIWLFELNLDHLNDPNLKEEERNVLEQDMHHYIKAYHPQLEKNTLRQLCTNYNRPKELLMFYQVLGDTFNILHFHCERNEWDQAFTILERQGDIDHYYHFIPMIIKHMPSKIVQLLMKKGASLEPSKLLPSFMKCTSIAAQLELIAYLEFCIVSLNNREASIHNYLLLLYAKYNDDESKLYDFLSTLPRYFHLDYALRICHQFKRIDSCIYLFGELEMAKESAQLSLKLGNVAYATQVAKAALSLDSAKEIWISIMKYLIDQKDFKKCLSLLKNNHTLHLNDVLKMFPNFSQMDDFKEELIAVLEEYVGRLNLLESEMETNEKSAEAQKHLIDTPTKNFFNPNETCPLCSEPLSKNSKHHTLSDNPTTVTLTPKGLAAFPCQHVLHHECCTQGLQSCPVCGDVLIHLIDTPFQTHKDLLWNII